MGRVQDKIAITGAAGGQGKEEALLFAKEQKLLLLIFKKIKLLKW